VGSTGGGNTCLETLCGCLVFELFPWPFVELPCNGTQPARTDIIGLANYREIVAPASRGSARNSASTRLAIAGRARRGRRAVAHRITSKREAGRSAPALNPSGVFALGHIFFVHDVAVLIHGIVGLIESADLHGCGKPAALQTKEHKWARGNR